MNAVLANDLFGNPSIERRAEFDGRNRLRLIRRWGAGLRACVIGHNPSDADGTKDDPTSRWWNQWFQLFGFGGYVAVNLYPWCSAKPADVYERVDAIDRGDWSARDELHFVNLPAVVAEAKRADQVFVCWGAIARDCFWLEHVIEEIQTGEAPWPDLWCWGTTASGAPKHPMARGVHRIPRDQRPILWRAI
jgi:hypothetical protein